MRITSPHAHGPMSTPRVMLNVLLATVPFFGFGTLVNILWGGLVAVACEALALKLRGRPLGFYLKDYSALVTATLLCIALPPYSPWWLIAVGIASAILLPTRPGG
jgi:electron transport complex protein RnfD